MDDFEGYDPGVEDIRKDGAFALREYNNCKLTFSVADVVAKGIAEVLKAIPLIGQAVDMVASGHQLASSIFNDLVGAGEGTVQEYANAIERYYPSRGTLLDGDAREYVEWMRQQCMKMIEDIKLVAEGDWSQKTAAAKDLYAKIQERAY